MSEITLIARGPHTPDLMEHPASPKLWRHHRHRCVDGHGSVADLSIVKMHFCAITGKPLQAPPITAEPTYADPNTPRWDQILMEADLCIPIVKPKLDFILVGHVPFCSKHETWDGQHGVVLELPGMPPRYLIRKGPGEPPPQGLAIRWDLSADADLPPESQNGPDPYRGWRWHLPEGADPNDGPATFGCVPAHHPSRKKFAGTFDEAWKKERAPLWPLDFKPEFFQSATVAQQLACNPKGQRVNIRWKAKAWRSFHVQLPDTPLSDADKKTSKSLDSSEKRIDTATWHLLPYL